MYSLYAVIYIYIYIIYIYIYIYIHIHSHIHIIVGKKILRLKKTPKNELLDKKRSQGNDSELIFNDEYYPVLRYLKCQVGKLHVILACDESRSPALPDAGRCEPCGVKRPPCQLYSNMKSASTLKSEH